MSKKEIHRIDLKTPSTITIKERKRYIKVYMSDCTEQDIDWIFTKDEKGIEKMAKVLRVFGSVFLKLKE